MTYAVELSDVAELELDGAYLWESRRSPEHAGRWYAQMMDAMRSLSEMPYRCALARDAAMFEEDVRCLLVGRGKTVYRVLFIVIEPVENELSGYVRVIHVRHGSRRSLDDEPDVPGRL